jgi:hypothetical protein
MISHDTVLADFTQKKLSNTERPLNQHLTSKSNARVLDQSIYSLKVQAQHLISNYGTTKMPINLLAQTAGTQRKKKAQH